ncbi:MAG: lipopolysaccharide biosynthesis protein [Sarcina sp.]
MRVENSVKNVKYNFIMYIISMLLGFVSRSFFIRELGIDLLGVNSIIANLLGFLNIAELGISMAITYSLYKPLSDKDNKKIGEIMLLFRHYYRRISFFVLIFGIILSLFLKFFIKGQESLANVYIYYYLFLVNAVITYLFSYRQTLIIADQREYIITISTNVAKIVKIGIQILILVLFQSYIAWILLEIIFNLGNLLYLAKKCEKLFPEVNFKEKQDIKKIKNENTQIIKDIKNVFMHKIATFIVFQTDGIVISIFLNLRDVGVYGNYTMLISSVVAIINAVMGSFSASVGNLVAESTKERVYDMFKKMYLLESFLALIIAYTMYHIINPFINIWLGNGFTFNMAIVGVLVVNLYIQISRNTVDRFRGAYGIFWDVYAPIIEGVVNLILSVILIQEVGIIGVLIGTLISNILVVLLWKPYTVYKEGFKISVSKYFIKFIANIITVIISVIIADFIRKYVLLFIGSGYNSLIEFFINAIITGIIISIVGGCVYLVQKDFRNLIRYAVKTLLKK